MVYTCQRCGYNTNVFFNFERHKNRVRPCKLIEKVIETDNDTTLINTQCDNNLREVPHNLQEVPHNLQEVNPNLQEVPHNLQEVNPNLQEVNPNLQEVPFIQKVTNEKLMCKICNKVLSSKTSLTRHEATCKGVHSLQCHKCLKEFNTKQAKYKHLKNVTCTPINPHYPMTVNNNTTNNNTTNNNTTNNNITNNTINNNQKKIIHQHIQINAFGNENYDYLLDENQRLKKMLVQKDAFMQNIIEAVHFDEEHPENHNIMMTNLQSKHVLIHDGTKFVKALKEPTFNKLIQSKRKIINGNIEELGLTIGSERYIKEKMTKLRVDDDCQKILKDKVELMCYNKKKMCYS